MYLNFMAYSQQVVSLELNTTITHQCSLHYTRDQHLIGIIEFSKSDYLLSWDDLEYIRRRLEEFSMMSFSAECIHALIIDLRNIAAFLDQDMPIFPWRLLEEECPIRLVVAQERIDHYSGLFEPTWLSCDVESAIAEIRAFMDMFVH